MDVRSATRRQPTEAESVRFKFGLRIPTEDGQFLSATAYLPKGDEPVPAIVELNPYTSDSRHDDGVFYAARGFAFVIVDAMGRGDSEGEFFGFIRDGQDGFDTIEWVAQQPWCDGQVGMHGSSYTGWNQWRVLGELPPSLRTIVPVGAALPMDRGSAAKVLAPRRDRAGQDWADSVEERERGVASVSAPVRDGEAVVAGVSVSGPVERTSRRPGQRYSAAVMAAARAVEAAAGYGSAG